MRILWKRSASRLNLAVKIGVFRNLKNWSMADVNSSQSRIILSIEPNARQMIKENLPILYRWSPNDVGPTSKSSFLEF